MIGIQPHTVLVLQWRPGLPSTAFTWYFTTRALRIWAGILSVDESESVDEFECESEGKGCPHFLSLLTTGVHPSCSSARNLIPGTLSLNSNSTALQQVRSTLSSDVSSVGSLLSPVSSYVQKVMKTQGQQTGKQGKDIINQFSKQPHYINTQLQNLDSGFMCICVYWIVDWTLDSIMDSISGLEFRSPRLAY